MLGRPGGRGPKAVPLGYPILFLVEAKVEQKTASILVEVLESPREGVPIRLAGDEAQPFLQDLRLLPGESPGGEVINYRWSGRVMRTPGALWTSRLRFNRGGWLSSRA